MGACNSKSAILGRGSPSSPTARSSPQNVAAKPKPPPPPPAPHPFPPDPGADGYDRDASASQEEAEIVVAVFTGSSQLPKGAVRQTFYIALKETPALLEHIGGASYHGHIRPEAKVTWMTFPGKYPAGWDSLVAEHHGDSVACVFLQDQKDGLGVHVPDPDCPGKCYCHKIYGERDYKRFGYLMTVKPPYTEELMQKHRAKASAMGAVIVKEDAPGHEREEAVREAKARWEQKGRVAAWGCMWYKVWLAKMREAVERKQLLKAVFFPNQVGMGKMTMQQLSQQSFDPWDGVGCGGSQKCELATADHFGWKYEEIDVRHFLRGEFPEGAPVDAIPASQEHGKEWRRGTVVDVSDTADGDGDLEWTVRCKATGRTFTSHHVCHASGAIQELIRAWGADDLTATLKSLLPGGATLQMVTESRLPTGTSAMKVTVEFENVAVLHALRDTVLSSDLDLALNNALSHKGLSAEVRVDKGTFLSQYEQSLLSLVELTQHQQEKLREVAELQQDVHLSAPAGAGKTFVAVQHVLRVLSADPSALVLYVATSEPLTLHFLRWMAVQLAGHADPKARRDKINDVLSRTTVLTLPFTTFRSPVVEGNRILFTPSQPGVENFDLAVFDESHHIFRPEVDYSFLDQHVHAHSRLLCSDESQSSAISQSFPEARRVRLTEVVRCTKRIVLAAAAFQVSDDPGQTVTSLGTVGPSLKTFLFENTGHNVFEDYTAHIVRAVFHLEETYPGTLFHQRLAILVPDSEFLRRLTPILSKALADGAPHRKFCLISFAESLGCLPAQLVPQGATPDMDREDIIFDTMNNADGLEQLIVICVGLDSKICGGASDLVTRALLYRGITRAQLLAMVVNEHVRGGWLEFLGSVEFNASELSTQLEPPRNTAGAAAASIVSKAMRVVEVSSNDAGAAASIVSKAPREGGAQPATDSSSRGSQYIRDVFAGLGTEPPEEAHQRSAAGNAQTKPLEEAQTKLQSSVWDTTDNHITVGSDKLLFDPLQTDLRERRALSMRRPRVACGLYHSAALRGDGTVAQWGHSAYSERDDFPSGAQFAAVACGGAQSVALQADGALAQWGDSGDRQRDDFPAGAQFVAVACGFHFAVALRGDGTLAQWGGLRFDQRAGLPAAGRFKAVACGGFHAVAVQADGFLAQWGRSANGQREDFPSGEQFVAAACGGAHSVALRADGTLKQWGGSSRGQREDFPSGEQFVAVACGDAHSVALRADGTLAQWGRSAERQREGFPSGEQFVAVACGDFHSVALRANGTVVQWGRSANDQRKDLPAAV